MSETDRHLAEDVRQLEPLLSEDSGLMLEEYFTM